MVTEQYVSFETARLLNKHGFDINTDTSYVIDNTNRPAVKVGDFLHNMPRNEKHLIAAPTQALVLRWLRETHKLHIEVEVYYCEDGQMWLAKIQRIGDGCTTLIKTCMCNDTYETAVENALVYCLNYFL